MAHHPDFNERFVTGEILAELARQRRTKKWLAEATGIARSTLYRRLEGKSPFLVEEMFKIAHALQMPVSDLFYEFEQGRRAS